MAPRVKKVVQKRILVDGNRLIALRIDDQRIRGVAAMVLNQIVYELPAEHPLADSRPLRELLGHTPSQVLGCGLLASPLLEEFQQDVAPLVH